MSASETKLEASRIIRATQEEIFAVLRSPAGHVSIDSSGMLQDYTGRDASAVGDRFTVHMDREALGDLPMGEYDVDVLFTKFDEPHHIEWTIEGMIKPPIGHVYGYQLAPAEDTAAGPATSVVSYCDWSNAHPDWLAIFPVIQQTALRATLGILARTVAARRA